MRLAILVSILFLHACGFTPIYQEGGTHRDSFKSIKVEEIAFGRPGQVLYTHLEDLLNPTSENVEKQYRLNTTVEKNVEPLVIEKDRTVTRYNQVITAKFTLTDIKTGKVVFKSKSTLTGSHDAVESDYSTFKAEEDTTLRIMQELAKDIRLRLSSYFLGKS